MHLYWSLTKKNLLPLVFLDRKVATAPKETVTTQKLVQQYWTKCIKLKSPSIFPAHWLTDREMISIILILSPGSQRKNKMAAWDCLICEVFSLYGTHCTRQNSYSPKCRWKRWILTSPPYCSVNIIRFSTLLWVHPSLKTLQKFGQPLSCKEPNNPLFRSVTCKFHEALTRILLVFACYDEFLSGTGRYIVRQDQ